MKQKYTLENIWDLKIWFKKPCIIFLKWDLWAWKTTISKHIINNIIWIKANITSPTYTYYNKYENNYHFDLYRLSNYNEFFSIWAEEIFDNNTWVILVEWPEIIEKYYKADIELTLNKTDVENERELEIIYIKTMN